MFASPVQLIPAGGAGTLIDPGSLLIELNVSGTPYVGGGNVTILWGGVQGNLAINVNQFAGPTTPQIILVNNLVLGTTTSAPVASVLNQPLLLTNLIGAFTGGSGNVIVTGDYQLYSGL
jgi:hypothetical protein